MIRKTLPAELCNKANSATGLTILVSLLDSGFDVDSVAGSSDLTFCFNQPRPNTDKKLSCC